MEKQERQTRIPFKGQDPHPVKDINQLPAGFLKECLDYNPETGILAWKIRPVHHFVDSHQAAVWNANHAGNEAGSKKCRKRSNHRSTIQICISTVLPEGERIFDLRGRERRSKSVLYSAHRLAFTLMGVDVPTDKVVDHINNDPWDNRWCNLRLATQRENCRNRGASFGKKSGLPRCVYRVTHGKKVVYEARVSLGGFATIEEALEKRNDAELKLFGRILHREDA